VDAVGIEINLPSKIVVAGGAAGGLAEIAADLRVRRPVLVTDPYLAERGPVPALLARLEEAGMAPALFAGVRPDPVVANVVEALAVLRDHGGDGVIAVGGGSPIDVAKAVAVTATNEGSIAGYAGYHQIPRPGLPTIAVPTTAGTGSEVTRVAVITDEERREKLMLLDNHLLCDVALVDFELTLSCPPELSAHVGVDSLTHAIESYVSSRANPVTDDWALRALRLIWGNLRTAVLDPGDGPARRALALGATLAGMAFSNASVALVHGMSRPLGAHFHLAHGLSNAVLLPAVCRFSLAGAPDRYARLARELGLAEATDPDPVAGERLVAGLEWLNEELGIPTLGGLGIERARLDAVAGEMAVAALASGSPDFNPKVPSAAEIVEIYGCAY
jgi:alcohol dehydrogenase class IV